MIPTIQSARFKKYLLRSGKMPLHILWFSVRKALSSIYTVCIKYTFLLWIFAVTSSTGEHRNTGTVWSFETHN